MKKLLALVLALVMSMSLVTISNAAFADADEIDYKEAVEVMNAVGVLSGGDGNKFNPKAELTRAQACKIIAYLDLGEEIAEALPALQVFSDVPANNWAAKYVAYCADAGYVSGVGGGKFDPDAKVTGYQFGKMLLCVLGYDAEYEQFTGSSWEINVAKKMKLLDLADKIEKAGSVALTREEAAQYAFNALLTQTVTANKGTTTKVEGVTVVTGGSAATPNTYRTGGGTDTYDYNDTDDNKMQLTEQLYGDKLKVDTDVNDAGKAVNVWYYNAKGAATIGNDDQKIGSYETEAADATIIATKAGKSVAYWLETLNKDYSSDSYSSRFNGTGSSPSSVALGSELLVFLDDNGDVDKVIVNTYKLAKITKVTEVTNKDFSYNVKFEGAGTYADTKLPGFDAKSMVKDDYVLVLYAQGGTATVLEVKAPATVEGKVTATGSDYVKVDGTKYTAICDVSGLNNDDVYCFYLVNGYVIGTEVVEESEKADGYVYLMGYDSQAQSGSDADINKKDAKVNVKVAYPDGTVAVESYEVKKASKNFDASGSGEAISEDAYYIEFCGDKYNVTTKNTAAMSELAEGFYAYTKNDAGEITLKKLDSDTEYANTVSNTADKGIEKDRVFFEDKASPAKTWKVNSSTKLVVMNTTDEKVGEFVGYKNFPQTELKNVPVLVVHAKDSSIATTVYVITTESYSNDTTYAYYIDDSKESVGSKNYYSFYVDGEKVTYELTSEPSSDIVAVNEEDKSTNTSGFDVVKTIVDELDDSFLVGTDGTAVEFDEDLVVWDVTDGVAKGEIAVGDSVVYAKNSDSKIDVVYVIESLIDEQPETKTELEALYNDEAKAYFEGADMSTVVTLGLAQVQDGATLYISGTMDEDKVLVEGSAPTGDTLTALKKFFSDDALTWTNKWNELESLGKVTDDSKVGFVPVSINGYVYLWFVTDTTTEFAVNAEGGITMTINVEGLAW